MIATLGAENSAPEVVALAKASSEKVQALLQPMNMVKESSIILQPQLPLPFVAPLSTFLIHYPRSYLGDVSRTI